jgi:hypothetical protein
MGRQSDLIGSLQGCEQLKRGEYGKRMMMAFIDVEKAHIINRRINVEKLK